MLPDPTTEPPSRPSRALHPLRRRCRAAVQFVTVSMLFVQIAGCALVDFEQRRWLFMPSDRAWGPGVIAAQGMDDVWIDFVPAGPDEATGADAARLHGLWLPQTDAAAPALLILHGGHWDVRASAPRMRQFHALGFAVLAIDYRGFGRSTPTLPSENMAVEDAHAAWSWLARQHPQARRFIFGHSLGGATPCNWPPKSTTRPA